jgi:hypothetical protein
VFSARQVVEHSETTLDGPETVFWEMMTKVPDRLSATPK